MNVVEFKPRIVEETNSSLEKILTDLDEAISESKLSKLIVVGMTKDGGVFLSQAGIEHFHELLGFLELAKMIPDEDDDYSDYA